MTTRSGYNRGRAWLLAWLVCGSFGSVLNAQTDLGPAEPVAPPESAAIEGTGLPEDVGAPDLEPAAPVDPIAARERLLERNIAEFGRASLQTAEAYIDLADAHRDAKDFDRAAENYLAAVEVYRRLDGPFTPLAIGPLTSLGDNYHDAEEEVQAIAAYTEARTVSRRAYGLHNQDQIELLDRMSRSFLELNEIMEADARQIEALRLVQRSNPPDSDAVLEAIYKYADWLGERLQFQMQREQYMRALRIIRQAHGERDVRQVRPLLGMGNAYRAERNPVSVGLAHLEDALELLLEQPDRDYVAIAGALRDIGDWSVAFGKTGYAGTEYERAWEMLGSAPNGEALRREWFTGINIVLREPISTRGFSDEPGALNGQVTVRFDIDTAGRSQNVTLVSSDPAGLKDEAVLRHIRRSRFRPVLRDGQLVMANGLAMQVNFRYSPEAVAATNAN